MADAALQLIVGLGNPGPQYQANRHNAGVIFLQQLCRHHGASLRGESRFSGELATVTIAGHPVRLLFPTTWMNHSGKAVAAVCQFFRIAPRRMLVAYDEIDFAVGITRFKQGGGHGGHNGIRDIITALGDQRDFHRLRIGVGHPGHKSLVTRHVLGNPSAAEAELMQANIRQAIEVMPGAVAGDWEQAMQALHTR